MTNLPISLDSAAYRMFIEEFDKHIFNAEQLLVNGFQLPVVQAKALAGAFHTIRGGAGFFGLAEIAGLAKELEELLFDFGDRGTRSLETVPEMIDKLKALGDGLPRPDK